jgi:putative tricarboxylic transport membrane protein
MDALGLLYGGFLSAIQPNYLAYALAGCALGTLIGVLPGLGPSAGTAILIPLTFKLDPTGAIIMLAAIYYGAMYGGTITSVLINVPGEAASVITCIDGHQMAKQGRGGTALGIAAIGSFVGGIVATVALVLVAPPLAKFALSFGPPEFFALMLFGLCLVSGLAGGSMLAALMMTVLGLLLAMIGIDPVRGAPRFAFEVPDLYDGIGFIPVVMGLFGISEILIAAEQPATKAVKTNLSRLLPTREEWKRSFGAIWRGTGIGFVLGLIPGIGSIVPTFMAYVAEKRLSKTPEQFGRGAIEGVAAPESANNSYANAAMIPFLTLGIPSSPTIAVLMGAFIINGITPGPFLFTERPDLVWTVIASFFVGNVILLALNLPLVGLWAKLLELPFHYLAVGVLLFCVVGAYSLQQSIFDVWVMIGAGVVGYAFRKLGLILGSPMEKALRTALEMSAGDYMIFIDRRLCLGLLIASAIVLVATLLKLAPKAVRQA